MRSWNLSYSIACCNKIITNEKSLLCKNNDKLHLLLLILLCVFVFFIIRTHTFTLNILVCYSASALFVNTEECFAIFREE